MRGFFVLMVSASLFSISAKAIVNGSKARVQDHPEVGLLVSYDDSPEKLSDWQLSRPSDRCSGVFISDSTLLTAGHCVRGANKDMEMFLYRWDEEGRPHLVKPLSVRTPYIYQEFPAPPNSGPVPGCSPGLKPLPLSKTPDVAVIEFPKGTSNAWVEIQSSYNPQNGDALEFFGFGSMTNPYIAQIPDGPLEITDLNRGTGATARYSDQRIAMITPDFKTFATDGDSGGPVYHNGRLVAIMSTFGARCDTEFGEDHAIQNTATRLTPAILRTLGPVFTANP